MKKSILLLRIIFTILLICTFVYIYIYSSEDGEKSSNKSKGIMYSVICVIKGTENVTQTEIDTLEPLLRKIAHFGIYIMSGIWSMCLMSTFFRGEEKSVEDSISVDDKLITRIKAGSKTVEFKRILISTIIGFLYACSDEIHQLFSPGRSGKLIDVSIDTMGVLNGVLLVLLICKLYEIIRGYKKTK